MFKFANSLLQFVITSMFVCLGGKAHRNVSDYFLPRVQLDVCKKFIFFLVFSHSCYCQVN